MAPIADVAQDELVSVGDYYKNRFEGAFLNRQIC